MNEVAITAASIFLSHRKADYIMLYKILELGNNGEKRLRAIVDLDDCNYLNLVNAVASFYGLSIPDVRKILGFPDMKNGPELKEKVRIERFDSNKLQ